ncbi:aminodeoxychorismate lyase [Pseudomonas sp. NW5]|uniref:aminodeoxychorismate lyase n=1 Tax=Pseudomonas sp. NW5 TaxID=2934934 RepID=UPI0020208F3F|nr:aminodeoxychorismate lyase [Pseudomonas sp. NW5]MCL7461622.1 aminodeoxychorismate lyase [Pseudomonas sp. NW5]
MLSWIDGRPAQQVPLTDRGLAYGDGLFETIAVRAGRMPLLARHLARLCEGCARLALPLERPLIEDELQRFARELGQGVVKLILTRGDGLRGYGAPQPTHPRRILTGNPPPAYPPAHRQQGITLYPCQTRLAHQPRLAGLKHLNRLEQVLARSEWQDSRYAEGLMRDMRGRVIEGVFSNLFLVRAGVLLTADLRRCGVAGTLRAELLVRAAAAGIAVQVRDLSLQDLRCADEVFMCNSLYGIWPVIAWQAQRWEVGPLTRTLQTLIADLLDEPA